MLLVLLVSVLGFSVAGPLVRLSHADPLAIAVWRLGFSVAIIGGVLVATRGWRQWKNLDGRSALVGVGAGALLALHFWSWNASLGYTTVAASVVLVNTQPVVVALLSAVWLHERPTRRQWIGIAIAMLGALVVASTDFGAGAFASRRALFGDALALIGAVTAGIYYVAGRRLRATLDLWPYVGLVYGSCFAVLLLLALAARVPVAPQPPREIAIFAALAAGPMLLGHTLLNWALRYLPAYAVNLALLGEPVGATLIAAFLPGIRELPSVVTLAGAALIIAGIAITLVRSRTAER